ncbi:MAG: PAS domain-containing sensor histidine kinase [Phycisphaeraceae bacterium]|nr:PAS domain-containing sensor histidine kinase [Phycisphaeraceae bacterium]
MTSRRFIWKIVPAYLLAFGLGTVGVAWYVGESVRQVVDPADAGAAVSRIYWNTMLGGLIMAVVSVVLTLVIFSRHVQRPLRDLQATARRYASGDLGAVGRSSPEVQEVADVTDAFEDMARNLDEKIRAITRHANERQAVLASMVEGVLAVDADERIITINSAASRLLEVEPESAHGRAVVEVIRHPKLQIFVGRAARSDASIDDEITVHVGDEQRLLQVQGAALRDGEGHRVGVVAVLHDVSRLRQLEGIRQQFVANVSHELKTPITAIKAAIETLIDERPETDAARRFLPLIARQSDRLHAIVEDLLTLARVEQDGDRQQFPRQTVPVLPVLRASAETCQAKADAKGVDLVVEADERLEARMNTALLEQAVVNLLDNAIMYSPDRGRIELRAARADDGEMSIEVRDHGPGIEPEHLPRLFERFYRPDRARSRDLGGTGLGLAIVKHVAQAHEGRASVDSTPGVGSVFRIHLPAA